MEETGTGGGEGEGTAQDEGEGTSVLGCAGEMYVKMKNGI